LSPSANNIADEQSQCMLYIGNAKFILKGTKATQGRKQPFSQPFFQVVDEQLSQMLTTKPFI